MALLGAQLVITLIMVSVIQKLGNYSFARWLLCSTGLIRYLYPDNNELKALAGVPKDKPKGKKGGKHEQNGKAETFHVPRSLEIQLETAPVTALDVIHLRYYTEYQWIVDFSLYTSIVYILSEIYTSIFPLKDEFNLSMVWCLLVVLFSFKILLTLTKQYFTSEESIGERSTCIVAFCVFLLIAMMVLIVDESNLEVGVDLAYDSFYENAHKFLENQGLSSVGPASKLILKFAFAIWAAIIGTLFTFPGLRVARMHWDSLRYYGDNKLKSALLNVNFAMPFVLALLWVRPVTRHYLTVRVFSGMEKPLMSGAAFDTLRLALVAGTVVLRLCLMPRQLQAYLDMAQRRLDAQRKEAGRITNVDLQKKVASVFYYLCVVALQYICPIIMCLYFALMYKTLGGYGWADLFYEREEMCSLEDKKVVPEDLDLEQYQMAWENLKMVFTQEVYRGVFGFATWWSLFAWFATTSLGLAYQTYFRIS
ncbi:transmembrane protein 161B [Leguminivora glycinivorella]|uniref:transmembrane protein 161B n=1 Tax=Leguminivora glycinivorella TaxID=1035111 RepID=UPI00200DCCC9|nr:transmembrane protein 161B [Leguminivora glycinivorella]XP_048007559.1 transmembrane protein 161B [Leguminivora glycinivorella]